MRGMRVMPVKALAVACAAGYPFLLLLLGWSFSPFNPAPSWGLAAEHGELWIEHGSLFVTAALTALPLAVASRFVATRVAWLLLFASALSAALPYAVQPLYSFPSNDSGLANFTWQVAALEVALAPLLLAAAIAGVAWLLRRLR